MDVSLTVALPQRVPLMLLKFQAHEILYLLHLEALLKINYFKPVLVVFPVSRKPV